MGEEKGGLIRPKGGGGKGRAEVHSYQSDRVKICCSVMQYERATATQGSVYEKFFFTSGYRDILCPRDPREPGFDPKAYYEPGNGRRLHVSLPETGKRSRHLLEPKVGIIKECEG